jgi:hypothetical protein
METRMNAFAKGHVVVLGPDREPPTCRAQAKPVFLRRVALAANIPILILRGMRKHIRNSPYAFPMTMALLAAASWETVIRRTS